MDYTRIKAKSAYAGIALMPPDILPKNKLARAKNIRSFEPGTVESRAGFARINSTALADAVHSVRRMNDQLPGATNPFIRVAGAGTKLYTGISGNLTQIDTGYSGNPIALVPFRPDGSPQSWMYVADTARMRKVNMDAATNYGLGIAAPNSPPTAALAVPNNAYLEDFQYASDVALQAVWIEGGTAGNPTRQQWRVNTTITYILYDAGTTGWACVNPAAAAGILAGSRLLINTGGGTVETVLIHDVFPATSGTITIGSIIYDSGTSGACSIVLSIPVREVQVDSMIRIAGAENCRVLSVTPGPNGLTCIRTSTTSTRAAGDSLEGLASFRAYFAGNHAAAETVTQDAMISSITTGTGYLTSTAIALNLSLVGGRPIQSTDYLQVGFLLSDPSKLTSGKIMFDIDVLGSGAGSVFARNFFYFEFRASDFVPAAQGSLTLLTTQQRAIQRQIIDEAAVISQFGYYPDFLPPPGTDVTNYDYSNYPLSFPIPTTTVTEADTGSAVYSSSSAQSDAGKAQWTQFKIPLSVLEANRVGSDLTRTWKDMNSCRVQFVVTGAVDVYTSAILVGGTYGPDVGDLGTQLLYRYRAESATGAMSNPSPPMRGGPNPRSERVTLSLALSADSQATQLRVERFGGNLQGWHRIGSVPNTGSPTFNDDFSDAALANAPPLELDNHQPFPTIDTPKAGTCNVAGTSVKWVSGDTFNVSWGRGTIINIAGLDYTFYNAPASTTFLQINENAGSGSAVEWYIKEPILLGQPLPSLWGPHPLIDVLFGCGSVYQPGTLFWTKPGNADSAPIAFNQEVTAPSEPLVNGLMLPDGRAIVYSSQRSFAIYPALNDVSVMTVLEAGKRGLFARRALCCGEGKIWFRAVDGIYESGGGAVSNSITDADLYVLFPHGDTAGQTFGDYVPPDDTLPYSQQLSYVRGWVYYDYVGTDALRHRLSYRVADKSWWPDEPGTELLMAYQEEGQSVQSVLYCGADGRLHTAGGTTDDGTAIPCQYRTGSEDGEDSRMDKQFGDVMFDFVSVVPVTVTIGFDNYLTLLTPQSVTNASRVSQVVLPVNTSNGQIARNIALDVAWTGTGPKFYEWQPSLLPRVEDTFLRSTDWDDAGYMGAKFVQGCIIECDTEGVERTVEIQYDGGTVGATLSVNADGQIQVPFSFVPFIGHKMRLAPTDSDSWRIYSVRWVYEPSPELATRWQTQPTTHDFDQYFHHDQIGLVALISTAAVTFTFTIDGVDFAYTIPSTSGLYEKKVVELRVMKGKAVAYTLTSSAGFRLFRKDCSLNVRGWGDSGNYRTVQPFGDNSRVNGALI